MGTFSEHLARLRGRAIPSPAVVRRPPGLGEPAIRGRTIRLADRAETDLCDVLAEHLRTNGWEVWFEVPLGQGRPDLVAIRANETLAVEAKLIDIDGVVKQGYRLLPYVDQAYVALPLGPASEVNLRLARRSTRGAERGSMGAFGIFAVGRSVTELRHPDHYPGRRIPTAELRRLAELHGSERGGVSGVDFTARNVRLWVEIAAGSSVADLAARHGISETAIVAGVRRLSRMVEHLASCPGGRACRSSDDERAVIASAHRHAAIITGLPTIDEGPLISGGPISSSACRSDASSAVIRGSGSGGL